MPEPIDWCTRCGAPIYRVDGKNKYTCDTEFCPAGERFNPNEDDWREDR